MIDRGGGAGMAGQQAGMQKRDGIDPETPLGLARGTLVILTVLYFFGNKKRWRLWY